MEPMRVKIKRAIVKIVKTQKLRIIKINLGINVLTIPPNILKLKERT